MIAYLDFEKPVAELRARAAELREVSDGTATSGEIMRTEARADKLLRDAYARPTPWQKTQVARHPERPHFGDYVAAMFTDFLPLARERAADAAEAMKVTAADLKRLGIVDVIVSEPAGGAQRDRTAAASALSAAIVTALGSLSGEDLRALRNQRRDKFLAMGGL